MGEGESLRTQIVNAALELFLENGYHSTSMQDIILKANCSKGGFYHHFSSKEDLLSLIHETFISYELERGERALQDRRSAADRLRMVIMDLVESIEFYRPHVTVFFEERRFLTSDKFSMVKEKRDRYEAMVRELVEEGIRTGEFRADLDGRVVTFAIFGMCNWTYQWMRTGGKLTSRQIGDTFSTLILQGLKVPSAGDGQQRLADGGLKGRRTGPNPALE